VIQKSIFMFLLFLKKIAKVIWDFVRFLKPRKLIAFILFLFFCIMFFSFFSSFFLFNFGQHIPPQYFCFIVMYFFSIFIACQFIELTINKISWRNILWTTLFVVVFSLATKCVVPTKENALIVNRNNNKVVAFLPSDNFKKQKIPEDLVLAYPLFNPFFYKIVFLPINLKGRFVYKKVVSYNNLRSNKEMKDAFILFSINFSYEIPLHYYLNNREILKTKEDVFLMVKKHLDKTLSESLS